MRRFPAKRLKIDQSFVKNMPREQEDRTIVSATISLAHMLGLEVVAEGVEDDETLAALAGMSCDYAQGYGICRPVEEHHLMEVLDKLARRLEKTLLLPA